MFNKKKKNNKGFTLVELLVVIAIIGILAVVAVPTLFKQIDKSKGADIAATVSAIKTATTSYYADNGDVPTSINNENDATSLVKTGYLDSDPNGDKTKVEYTLTPNSTDKTATLSIVIKGNYMDSTAIQKLEKDLGVTAQSGTNEKTLTIKLVN